MHINKILGRQRLGQYEHRDGRKVQMITGIAFYEQNGKEAHVRVYFYVYRGAPVFINRDILKNDWNHCFGNHTLGKNAGFQKTIQTGEKENRNWPERKQKK